MDEIAFMQRMREVDNLLAARKVSALWRPLFAWFEITGLKTFYPQPRDAKHSAFEDPNLFHEIEDWYRRHYPHHTTIRTDWGSRWFIIRGEFFRAPIPIIFNPTAILDPFEIMSDLPKALVALLSTEEKDTIGNAFNGFFQQASDINLNMTIWRSESPSIVADFLERGWADLRDAGTAFSPNDPTSVLFTTQQAAEKYLKALLLTSIPDTSEDDLRRKYGHDVGKLFKACLMLCPNLSRLESHIQLLEYGPNVRYERGRFCASEVVARMNLAYAICHASAKALLSVRKGLWESSRETPPN